MTVQQDAAAAAGTGRPALPRPGRGLLVALLLLALVEASLHTNAFLYRFRSVFAAGRALDKVLYVESHRPSLLILGNSRADNGFDPRTVERTLGIALPRGAFNLGLPGANARVLGGILLRLDRRGLLGPQGVSRVVLSLDEALVQANDSLGQDVFFASPGQMWADGQMLDAFRATFRLYGYSENFAQLREPAVLARFLHALVHDTAPVGGEAADHLGYRAGFGALQDLGSALRQEAEAVAPPDPVELAWLWRMLDLLAARRVQVAVVFPPLLNRQALYLADGPGSAPYHAIRAELQRRGIASFALDSPPHDPAEFINPGHLDDRGAQRYSALLGRALARLWGGGTAAAGGRAP